MKSKTTAIRQARLFLAMLIVALAVYNFILAAVASRRKQQRQQQGRSSSQPPSTKQHDLLVVTRDRDHDPGVVVCLTESCLRQQGQRLARAFDDRPKSTWCIRPSSSSSLQQRQQQQQQRQQNNRHAALIRRGTNSMTRDGHWQGLLLVKVPKAASSTSAGLTLRMANASDCHTTAVQYQHREGIFYANRTTRSSFLMAPIRQPSARAFSSTWFFLLAPLNITDTDENVMRGLNTRRGGGGMNKNGKGGYQFNYLSLEPIPPHSVWSPEQPTRVLNASFVHDRVQALLQGYDFFIVVERWDESMVALALLTGLNLGDVLTPRAKVSGDYRLQRFGRKKGQCHYQRKGIMSPAVKAYFESDTWRAMNYADEVLWRAANASLDLTIERLRRRLGGRERFDVALAEYKRLQQKVEQMYGQRLGYGCTAQGEMIETTEEEEQACYDRDFGCGYQLLDALMDQEREARGHAEIVPGVAL